ncbi:kinase-like domain-containing protein [Melanogaster broomeanus]|nr:kinase-like domain-containing protein [Melanogaster broomeanus]
MTSYPHASRSNFASDLTDYVKREGNDPIASGGYGDVYRGTFRVQGRSIDVAVKAIRTYTADDEDYPGKKKILRREIKVWLSLNHVNVVPLFGTTMDFGRFPAMVCPWLENGQLSSYLERRRDNLTTGEMLTLLSDVAVGLQYLHSQSVVHGDLSGSNVLIDDKGRACITDFGLSMLLSELGGSTFATSVQAGGTLRWAAPENMHLNMQVSGENVPKISPTTRSDIYSLGRIMLQVRRYRDSCSEAMGLRKIKVLTGKIPYHYYPVDARVVLAISQGENPQRPDLAAITDRRWAFIQKCWSTVDEGHSRPSDEEVVEFMRDELVQMVLSQHRGVAPPGPTLTTTSSRFYSRPIMAMTIGNTQLVYLKIGAQRLWLYQDGYQSCAYGCNPSAHPALRCSSANPAGRLCFPVMVIGQPVIISSIVRLASCSRAHMRSKTDATNQIKVPVPAELPGPTRRKNSQKYLTPDGASEILMINPTAFDCPAKMTGERSGSWSKKCANVLWATAQQDVRKEHVIESGPNPWWLWREMGDVVKHTHGVHYLVRLIRHQPGWFLDKLLNLLETNRFVSAHYTTIHRELERVGISVKKLKRIAKERNDQRRMDFIIHMSEYSSDEIGFLDETSKDERAAGRRRRVVAEHLEDNYGVIAIRVARGIRTSGSTSRHHWIVMLVRVQSVNIKLIVDQYSVLAVSVVGRVI